MELRVAVLAAEAAVVGFVVLMLCSHILLRLLLSWHGFMHEARNPSLFFKIWAVCVKLLTSGHPSLYSFQRSLPSLPVPPLHRTVAALLASVRPVVEDAEYARLERLGREFLEGHGPKLQRYLVLKSYWAPNYVTDWWEKYVVRARRRRRRGARRRIVVCPPSAA